MSVGLGRIERRVLKVLARYRQHNEQWRVERGLMEEERPDALSIGDIVGGILYGCDKDWPAEPPPSVLYQSVCRAVRSLERKRLVRTSKRVTFWEDGSFTKTVTLLDDRTKQLNTVENGVGVNV